MYKNNRVVAIIQARMGSTRLPGKVLMEIGNKKVLSHIVYRLEHSKYIDNIVIATSFKKKDEEIVNWCKINNINFFQGPEENVLERFYLCNEKFKGDIISRITGDCPLVDFDLVDQLITFLYENNYDYVSMNTKEIPRGLHGEVFKKETLEKIYNNAYKKPHFEHVTYYVYEKNNDKFNYEYLTPPKWLKKNYRLTLDTQEDLKLLRKIFNHFSNKNNYLSIFEVINFLNENPKIALINNKVKQKKITD
ncbi:MAG: cytidylyltransferase domain-containing protein [bacterium]